MIGLTDGRSPAVVARRAIEALRAGVPSRDAVAALGSGQSAIEDRFETMCASAAAGSPASMLIGGGFGAGKSHLLEHLARLALNKGWTVSRVVVSKETPLHDPAKVFRAAADSALRDGQARPAIIEAAAGLDLDGRDFAELLRWASSSGSELNERFPASLVLFAHLRERDPSFAETVLRFWSGDPIAIPELRRRMREVGEQRPVFAPVAAAELARQRMRFAARLLAAAGSPGWLVLFDEVELIGRYSLLQRAKSYAELARWMRGENGRGTPMAAVLAMTDDFEAAVITGRNDRHVVPERLLAKGTPDAAELAAAAELGMRIIDRETHLLTPPDDAELKQVYTQLRELHGQAFGWYPPDVTGLERLGATRMRQYVRAWINEWDLVRLDPGYRPETEAVTVISDYREDPDLEHADSE
ncbi:MULTISPECIES: BREX system ATP-binding domain-containing protein [unclassified Micromonospora]|uniref:BREX system ATP-binding domain-containing protein n=1 Tax=unclassified Micromonospora TaxID=2617518 RepID=UPI00362A78F6